jgi:type II secretory pathway component PulF
VSVWRYTAIELRPRADGAPKRGEVAGETPREARSSLRRIGLQVIDLRRVRSGPTILDRIGAEGLRAHLRRRRRHLCAELYDGLSTLLDSGAPLLEAVDTELRSQRSTGPRNMLLLLHEALRSGDSLSAHMSRHPAWFDRDEVAMVRAGERSGELSRVLRSLAERNARAGELGHRLVHALAYPTVVLAVGIAALLFLSTKTLPELVRILRDADVETPALTAKVMALGQAIASWGFLVLPAVALAVFFLRRASRCGRAAQWLRRLSPELFRRMTLGGLAQRFSELLRSGVPAVEALRVLAPTVRNPGLQERLARAADRVERGEELSSALDDEHWFDPEFRRLVDIGLASGELDTLLSRLGERYERRARRLLERWTALLEPAVILTLAVGIGTVVVAAVLPMIRLQEVLK